MHTIGLDSPALARLFEAVFDLSSGVKGVALLVDLPDSRTPDSTVWKWRRQLALQWCRQLREVLDCPVQGFAYENVACNNADLPDSAYEMGGAEVKPQVLREGAVVAFSAVFERYDVVVALTHFSATAPLKLAAPSWGLRAATMPGFSPEMLPALELDFNEVARRVDLLTAMLTEAESATVRFVVDGSDEHVLELDLRHRSAHASSGLIRTRGKAGNLPSGEAYIVPYEGELVGEPSRTGGVMPVQLGDDVVLYEVVANKAVAVLSSDPTSAKEADYLRREPAYGNLAELGLGVLGELGVKPIGTVLLDEKLGVHIAFGRSDHFGGQVGAKDFSAPEAVVHIDRVYVPEMQPRVRLAAVDLHTVSGSVPLIRADRYVVDFS